jgi:hypothetical protein
MKALMIVTLIMRAFFIAAMVYGTLTHDIALVALNGFLYLGLVIECQKI